MAAHAKKATEPAPERPAPKKTKDPTLGESAADWAARVSALAEEIANGLADARTARDEVMTHAPAADEYDVAGLVARVNGALNDVDTALASVRATVGDLTGRVA